MDKEALFPGESKQRSRASMHAANSFAFGFSLLGGGLRRLRGLRVK
jgi:hypothetical protein